MATIREVAAAAGVSVGTVSNFLNARVTVAASTAARIQEAIDLLGYRVDASARAFRTRQTNSIGLVVPNVTNPYFAEIARAVAHALWKHGIQTFLCDAADDEAVEQAHVEQLIDRRVDGILMSYTSEPGRILDQVAGLGVPIVFIDRAVPGHHSVETDNRCGGALAARHLVALGHRRVGVLAGAVRLPNIRERVQGFVDEMCANGVEVTEGDVLGGPQAAELGRRVCELMDRPSRPTAVFATNDIVAIGAWRALVEIGVRVPEQISLVGFDDIEMSRLTVPDMTTIAQDKVGIGQAATTLLLDVMRGRTEAPRHVRMEPRLLVRGSTARAADPEARYVAA
jgi:LacI family transcriptional regulator